VGFVDDVVGFDSVVAIVAVVLGDPVAVLVAVDEGIGSARDPGGEERRSKGAETGNGRIEPGRQA